jgi:Glycosyltransferase
MNIGIDLLWVVNKNSGGIVSYINNLLKGFSEYADDSYNFTLFLSKDNYEIFDDIPENDKFSKIICNIRSRNILSRILWQNIYMNRCAKLNKVSIMFSPTYSKPLWKSKVKYVTTIHDLQALHYPEYFTRKKYYWLKYAWKRSVETSDKIIAISKFVKNDIVSKLGVNSEKIITIYNPIIMEGYEKFDLIEEKYKIQKSNYFYTVSSKYKHKNLMTLLRTMKEIKERYPEWPQKLVISGTGGYLNKEISDFINNAGIHNNIILTGFVSNKERNSLYKNSSLFLFPSVFEGFGMPVIEAMKSGVNVVTTKSTSLPEVSENKAIYVENFYDIEEWIAKIKIAMSKEKVVEEFPKYELQNITNQYLNLFSEVIRGK